MSTALQTAVTSTLNRVASFGRRPKKAQRSDVVLADPVSLTPRLQKPSAPKFLTPRLLTPRTATTISFELYRESKTEPLGIKFALLSDYFSGVIVTEVSDKAAAAGFKPGDCVVMVGSKSCTTVEEVEKSLKRIAGSVEVQVSRSKKLPAGWMAAVDDDGKEVLQRRAVQTTELSRAQCELCIETVMGASSGMQLTTNSKGHVVVHSIQPGSVFSKHIKVGDKLSAVNGDDFSSNPLGAGRALTGRTGTLRVKGTFVPPSEKCALTGCECCAHLMPTTLPAPPFAPKPMAVPPAPPMAAEAAVAEVSACSAEDEVVLSEVTVTVEEPEAAEAEAEVPAAVVDTPCESDPEVPVADEEAPAATEAPPAPAANEVPAAEADEAPAADEAQAADEAPTDEESLKIASPYTPRMSV